MPYGESDSRSTGKLEFGASVGVPDSEVTPRVREAMVGLVSEVDRLRAELRETRARIEYLERLADQDALAPIANRRAFVRELSRTIAYAHRHEVPASVIYLDLNEMKALNDRHGHVVGDAALLHVARTLIDNLRTSDLVGRLGGDEFGIILLNADLEGATEKAEQLAGLIAATAIEIDDRTIMADGKAVHVSVSFGVHCLEAGEDATTALARADKAMYSHKQAQKRAS